MPVQSFGHSHYWQTDDGDAAEPAAAPLGGYPTYQASTLDVFVGSLFGSVQIAWERLVVRWHTWRRDYRRYALPRWVTESQSPSPLDRLRDLDAEQQLVLTEVLMRLTSPEWEDARQAVRQTATTLGFNRPEAWIPYSRALKRSHRDAENVFRRLHAITLIHEAMPMTNPQRNLLAELAYCGFERKPDS